MSTSRAYIQKSKTNYWGTPRHILDQYKGWFDPCPFPKPEWDGLTVNWLSHEKVFCNPPYDNIKAWAKKCYETLMMAIQAKADESTSVPGLEGFAEE